MGKLIRRGITFQELRWPMERTEYRNISKEWPLELVVMALQLVWSGYDLLQKEVLTQIDCQKANKQIEKSITHSLQLRINRVMTRDEPFDIQHEVPEFETSYSDQAHPPSYDMAFILKANERIMLPLEAKVLSSENAVSQYVNELKLNFLTCRYAPFSSTAVMLGYLLKGRPEKVFEKVEKSVQSKLLDHSEFLDRAHKISNHQRNIPSGKSYSPNFCCHHLVLEIKQVSS